MILFLLSLALAEPSPAEQTKYIPLGTPTVLRFDDVLETVRCYRLGEFKLLLQTDFDLQDAETRLQLYDDINFKYGQIVSEKNEIIQVLKKEKEIYRERSERMETNWHDAEERAISIAEGPLWPYVVAGVGAVIGVVGATLYVQEMVSQ